MTEEPGTVCSPAEDDLATYDDLVALGLLWSDTGLYRVTHIGEYVGAQLRGRGYRREVVEEMTAPGAVARTLRLKRPT